MTKPDPFKCLNAVLTVTEDVKDACYRKMWEFQRRGEVVIMRDVAEKTIACVKKFKEMGNMISLCDLVALAITWAPIKCLIEKVYNQSLARTRFISQN